MIDAITIEGYKSIKAQEVKLSPINILIGGNGIGKTNFISAFELIRDIYEQQLQNHVLRKGGANCLLYNGKKYTDRITVDLLFTHDHSKNRYIVVLEESQDRLFVKEAKTAFLSGAVWHIQTCDTNKEEASIKQDRCGQAWYVGPLLEQFEIYHFHDTGDKSPMKDFAPLHDNVRLKRDGSNIAPYLYLLKQKYLKHYLRIEKMVASVSPFFDSFVLEPNRLNPNTIRLEWKQKDVPDMTFNAYQLSDGSLRFICLAALLMQPEPPQTILIDEPELGLHPLAINKLCAMLKKVSSSSQIIVSTQSVNLVDNFAPEDIIVADRKGNETVFCRLDGKELEGWLKDYSMGELWEKNLVCGQPF